MENKRLHDGRILQRQVLYPGEINDSQRAAWRKTLDAFVEGEDTPRQIALFPHDRPAPVDDASVVQIRLRDLTLHRPRQWGGGWLALELYQQLGLHTFFAEHLPPSRKGTAWDRILQVLVTYRLRSDSTDKTTLKDFLTKIETCYGKARRIWLMDRGIPTEATLEEPGAARQPAARLPRRGERSEANAHQRSPRAIPGRHSQGPPHRAGSRPPQTPVERRA